MDFKKDKCLKAYRSLFDSTGFSHSNSGNGLSLYDFANGNMFIAFDLTPDQCNGWHAHERVYGPLDLHLKFRTGLPDNINVIIYASFENTISIDKNRNFLSNYTV